MSKFVYQKRTKQEVQKRVNQKSGAYDSIFGDAYDSFAIKEGDQRLRILPPTWQDADHYGLDIYVHYGIGPDEQTYLCLEKNSQIMESLGLTLEECPICAECRKAEAEGMTEYADDLSTVKRVLVWILDRNDEDAGPLLWAMPWTIDRDIASVSMDKASGEFLCIDDPEEGFDVVFTREGKGMKTKYIGIQVARRSTKMVADPEELELLLDFIVANPLPKTLNFFSAAYISSIFAGTVNVSDSQDEEMDELLEKKPRTRAQLNEPDSKVSKEDPPEIESPHEYKEDKEDKEDSKTVDAIAARRARLRAALRSGN